MSDDNNSKKVKGAKKSRKKERMTDGQQQESSSSASNNKTTSPTATAFSPVTSGAVVFAASAVASAATTASPSSTTTTPSHPSSSSSAKHIGKASKDGDNHNSSGQSEKHSLFSRHKSLVKPTSSVRPKNFKRKLIALMKKIRPKSEFDNEEQYREALKKELLKAAASAGKDTREIEELLEDGDLEDADGANVASDEDDLDFDWDSISYSSTPKPSLRPFFSSTTLDKI